MALFEWKNGTKTQNAVVTSDGVTVQDAVWEGETPISASNLNSAQEQLKNLVMPTGTILQYGGSTSPEGFLICDGSAISRTTYANLFNILGTNYGDGDGATTFNLPNLKGKVAIGYDSSDEDFNELGETGGSKTHRHYNGVYAYNTKLHITNTNSDQSHPATQLYSVNGTTGFTSAGNQNAFAYSTEDSNNLQPYQVVNYIIKY